MEHLSFVTVSDGLGPQDGKAWQNIVALMTTVSNREPGVVKSPLPPAIPSERPTVSRQAPPPRVSGTFRIKATS